MGEEPSTGTGTGATERTHAFEQLLERHRDGLVAAIGDDGIFVPMPASVPLLDHRVVVGRSVIDMVVPADKMAVITAWERSRSEGSSQTVVHLVANPDQGVILFLVDARPIHGAHLATFLPAGDGQRGGVGHGSASITVVPRTARARKNELAVLTEIDHATTQILGWEPEQMIGRRSLEFVHPDDQDRAISNWMEMLTAPGHDQRVRLRHLAADGGWVWLEITNRNLLETPEACVVTEMLDISEELAAQEALRASEQLLRRLAESLPLGVVQIEADRTISYANQRSSAITGAGRSERVSDLFGSAVADDAGALRAALDHVLDHGVDQDLQVRFGAGAGAGAGAGERLCTISMRALTSDTGAVTGAIVCISDVTDQVRMTAELEHRATFDELTGCYNRQASMTILDRAMDAVGAGLGLIFVDLDGFKQINDGLGHAAGDAVLVEVGRRLRDAVRDDDVVGRVGGDEFLVVCRSADDLDGVRRVADRIDAALDAPVLVDGTSFAVGASLGVAHTDVATSSDRLVAAADAAMYEAKRGRGRGLSLAGVGAGSGRPSVLRTRAAEEERALRAALDRGELEVHYQPVISLGSRTVAGFEALIRWRRDGELLPAIAFIDLAQRSELIVDIGTMVIDRVCADASRWEWAAVPLRWGINLSPRELASGSARVVADALARHDVPAERIVVEVTEHADLTESGDAVTTVHQLAEMGVGLALDDFGTGHSSLALLRSLPVDCLKLDRSFTAGLGVDPAAADVIEVCRDLARRRRMAVVVEGVETEEQAQWLFDAGIQLAQGYLFSAARPLHEIADSLGTGQPAFG